MDKFFESEVTLALSTLRDGKVILYPTDTIWGLGCDATNTEAIERVFSIKQHDDVNGLVILIAEERDVLQYVAAPDLSVFDIWEEQVRPTTIIFENAVGLPQNLLGGDGSIAIRLVKDPFCRHLIKRLGAPIVSTSANNSDKPHAANYAAIVAEIKNGADHIVAWRQDEPSTSQPSQIIKWHNSNSYQIIRP